MAWFLRGAQSAFFYYVSCAPCANARFNHRRAKEKARVERATKKALLHNGDPTNMEKLHADDEDLLAGVGAFTTNIYWQEEIDLGPTFKRGMRPQQDLNRLGKDDKRRKRAASEKKIMQEDIARREQRTGASMDTLRLEEDAAGAADASGRPLSSMSGNKPSQRYQRGDEALWGNPHPDKDWAYYARGRNPAINDMIPPVVSTLPATAEEASWMLQPPPPAKVMEGKQMPIKRATSTGAASKVSVVSRISKRSGGTRFSELKRPEQILLADLGDNICSMSVPPQAARKFLRRISRHDGTAENSRPTTPSQTHKRQDSTFSSFDSTGRNISRQNRPPPIQTAVDSDTEDARDENGFNPHFTFPRRTQGLDSPPELTSAVSPNLYYHSEPEPGLAHSYGISYQDFARRTVRPPTTADSDAPFQTPKSKATTRAGSNSPSPTTLSPDSSSSSLHVLKDVLAPTTIVDATNQKHHDSLVPFDAKHELPAHMEGISEEDLENVIPRFSSGPRQVRLGSGTQV